MSLLAEYERELIVERTKAGLKAARARGRCGGRPRALSKQQLRLLQLAVKDKSLLCPLPRRLVFPNKLYILMLHLMEDCGNV